MPYYFYLVHVIYFFYLTKINLFIFIPYPNQVYDKQRKKHFSVVTCVSCAMSCSEIFLSQDSVFQHSMGSTKKVFLVNTCLISQFGENVNSFNFLANALLRSRIDVSPAINLSEIFHSELYYPSHLIYLCFEQFPKMTIAFYFLLVC